MICVLNKILLRYIDQPMFVKQARVRMHSAMASGAPNPAAHTGDEGFTICSVEFSDMAATPNSRRPSTTAPSLETDPKAKRSQHVAPASVSDGQRDFSPTELSTGSLELNDKAEAQAARIAEANDAVDDHASCLDTWRGLLARLDKTC